MIGYPKFLMKYPGFWHNQIYKSSYIYNKNNLQVYNKMHMNK